MPTYDSITDRDDASALIPEDVSTAMLENLQTASAARALFTTINIPRNVTRFPVLSALPTAYFVDGDTGMKETTELGWDNAYLNVEELAAILPIPDNVVADMDADVWGTAQPLLEQAIARALDAAIFFGVNAPGSWPDDIVTAATAAGNVVTRGTATVEQGGVAEDINQLMGTVEEDGYDVNGFVVSRRFRSILRSARDSSGQRLLDINGNVDNIEGLRVVYAMPGMWGATSGDPAVIAGDFTRGVLGIRQDITFRLFSEGVVTDADKNIIYNLMQQDMKALRVTFRVGFAVANPINYEQEDGDARYPFGVMLYGTNSESGGGGGG
jgi:HK97 family phage major capsid protein